MKTIKIKISISDDNTKCDGCVFLDRYFYCNSSCTIIYKYSCEIFGDLTIRTEEKFRKLYARCL